MPTGKSYLLLGTDRRPYRSSTPGTVGGHRGQRIYGRLNCPAALRAIARGGYVLQRVFFADEDTAIAAGFRPCAVCLPKKYTAWKCGREAGASTEAELTVVLELLVALRPRADTIVVGTSRDPASRRTADQVAHAWTGRGGHVLDKVDWPEEAASWLRQARRFTAQGPDAWFVTGRVPGWIRMGRRLARSTDWDPARTIASSSLADDALIARGGPDTFDGLRGASADGGTWEINRTLLLHHAPRTA